MSGFNPQDYMHSWEEQGCIERIITMFFYLLGILFCIGVAAVILMSAT